MPTLVECPSCSGKVRVPDSLLGRRARCPRCSHVFAVGAPEELPPPAPPERPTTTAFTPEPAPPRPRREAPGEWEEDEDIPRESGTNPYALASMILGITSLPMAFCCGAFGMPISVLAVVFGVIGMRTPEGRGMGIAGVVTGGLGLVLLVAMMALGLAFHLANLR